MKLIPGSHLTSKQIKMPWLMKAEPDTRIVKGKDVKVSIVIQASAIRILLC